MKILVTGATGYIGMAAAKALRAEGHDVVGLARSDVATAKLLQAGIHPIGGISTMGTMSSGRLAESTPS